MKTKKSEMDKVLDEIKDCLIKENIINSQLCNAIEQVYKNTIIHFKKEYNVKGKTLQEIEEYSELVITLADVNIVTIISSFSLDCSYCAYELPSTKLQKLIKFYARILIRNKKKSNLDELFLNLFQISYASSMKNAIAYRTKVLEQRKKIL